MPTQRIAVRIPRNQTDPDAQAFITAAGITDSTQQSAINTLVTNLKSYGIWTKMKAIYPFVGGTATSHKFNLKNPLNTNAAYRLVFNGGWTHSSTGALPNGTNAFADTYLIESVALALNNAHLSIYSRTESDGAKCDIGSMAGFGYGNTMSAIYAKNGNLFYPHLQDYNSGVSNTLTSKGLFISNRTSSSQIRAFQNNVLKPITSTSVFRSQSSFTIGALNRNSYGLGGGNFSDREIAFASIGDGLTDTEAANFHTAVQAYQTTLGRSIGTQTVSDADAQAFINAAQITDQVQATAINNLVVGLKADSIWTKMKALYPMVGGTAASHKFNLKDPRDLDVAFRLQFNGGWTHSANGALPNKTNAYGNTYFRPSVNGTGLDNLHIGYYSRTNNTTQGGEIGIYGPPYTVLFSRWNDKAYFGVNGTYPEISNTNSSGLFVVSRINSTTATLYRNNSTLLAAASNSTSAPIHQLTIGAIANSSGIGVFYYTDRQCAFASIGDGLTDAEAANFYTRVQAFQTTLGRQV